MKSKVYIKWKDRYSVGQDDIDADHKAIIEIINDLYSSIQNDKALDQINAIIKRLLEYTKFHFSREERIMADSNYPQVEKHKATHAMIMERTHELAQQALCNKLDTVIATMAFLKDWWVDHILIKDSQYKPYITESHKDSQPVK